MKYMTTIAVLMLAVLPLHGQSISKGIGFQNPQQESALAGEVCDLRALTEYMLYLIELRFTELRVGPLESRLKEIESLKRSITREIELRQREAGEIDSPTIEELKQGHEREDLLRQRLNEMVREADTIRLDLDRMRGESEGLRAELSKRSSTPRCATARK